MLKRSLGDPEHCIDIGLDRGVEGLGRQILQLVAELLAARVVDQDVQPAQALDRLCDQGLAEVLVPQVAGNGDGAATLGLDQGGDLVSVFLFVGQIVDRDIRPFAGIGDGGRRADAAVAASDQGALALQAPGAAIAVLAVVGQRVHPACQSGKGLFLFRKVGPGQARAADRAAAEGLVAGHDGLSFRVALSNKPRPQGFPLTAAGPISSR